MKSSAIRQWLCGPMVAVATPFKPDFSLDLEALQHNVRFMVDRGVRTGAGSLLVGGAGGEHPALDVGERKAVMDAAVESARGEVPVLTSVQHVDTRAVVELARHASEAGLQGVQLGPTYYYVPTEADIFRLFQLVASETDVTLMIYHTWWEGRTMSLQLLRRLAELPSVRALKWSAPDAGLYQQGMLELAQELAVIDNSGQHVWSHLLGARGFITHLSGFWPQYPSRIWELLESRDYVAVKDTLAAFKWPWADWVGRVMAETGGEAPFIKAAMEAVGLPAGPPRPPSSVPSDGLIAELRALLADTGVLMATDNPVVAP